MSSPLEIILSSAVIVAILNNIVLVYNHKEDSKLQHITSERSEWRKTLKEIALDIQDTSFLNIKLVLTKLKVRINAYGQHPDGNYPKNEGLNIMIDEHIWKIIHKIENSKDDKEFERNKDILTDSLSCLLKFDWERSKAEVNSSKLSIISIVLLIISIACYIGFGSLSWSNIDINNIQVLIGILFMLILPYTAVAVPYWIDTYKFNHSEKLYQNIYIISYLVGFFLLFIISLCSYFRIVNKGFGSIILLCIFSLLYALSILSFIAFFCNKNHMYINYEFSIKKILKKSQGD